MKKVEVIVKPYQLEDVRDVLQERGSHVAMTVSEIRRYPDLAHTESTGSLAMDLEFLEDYDFQPRLKIEMVINDDDVEEAIGRLDELLKGKTKILVQEITGVVRIRTNERGAIAV